MKIETTDSVTARFKSSIKRGTGEAYYILKQNPEIDLSPFIIKAALKNLSYDNQSEGDRADYIFSLIQLSKQKEKIRKGILKALTTEKDDRWALEQLFDIAALFAKKGDEEAKELVYKEFNNKESWLEHWSGENAIIAIDGFKGLIKALERRTENYEADSLSDYFLIDEFQKNNPLIKVYIELRKEVRHNSVIKKCVELALKQKRSQKRKRIKFNYEVVAQRIRDNKPLPLLGLHAKDLSKSDIKKLADDFANEKEPANQVKYLKVFQSVKYPYSYQYLLNFAKAKYKPGDNIVYFAVRALHYFKENNIRDFALEIIPKTKHPAAYIGLLVANYQPGDSKLLEALVNKTNNVELIHQLVFGLVNIYEANKTKDCKLPLLAMYGKLTCGLHREDIVQIMMDNKVLPPGIKRELKYDSYEGVRKLYKK